MNVSKCRLAYNTILRNCTHEVELLSWVAFRLLQANESFIGP